MALTAMNASFNYGEGVFAGKLFSPQVIGKRVVMSPIIFRAGNCLVEWVEPRLILHFVFWPDKEESMAYHMRRKDRKINDENVLDDIIDKGQFAVLALCRKNEPYCVTLSYGFEKACRTLYFHAASTGLKLDILKENPEVCLMIVEDNGYLKTVCSHAYRTVVIRGAMEFLTEKSERIRAVEVLINHFEGDPAAQMAKIHQETAEWENTQMLRLKIREMTGKERKTISPSQPKQP